MFLIALLFVNNKSVLAIANFDVNFYGNKYVFESDLKLNLRESYFSNLISIGGYVKQSTINNDAFNDYIINHNYPFNLNRKIEVNREKENYFYKIYASLRLLNFDNSYTNNSIFFNISYYNSIKYFEYLKLTFINDIYERYGFGLNYYFNNNNSTTNIFTEYIITADKIKNTLSAGFNTKYNLNSALALVVGYEYSKDFIKNENQQTLVYDLIAINYMYEDIKNESHTFSLNTVLRLDDYLNINLGLSYLVNKDCDNSLGFNVSLGF